METAANTARRNRRTGLLAIRLATAWSLPTSNCCDRNPDDAIAFLCPNKPMDHGQELAEIAKLRGPRPQLRLNWPSFVQTS